LRLQRNVIRMPGRDNLSLPGRLWIQN
jgi:hypothetical protein